MELKWLKVKAFKRFHELSTLNLSGRLVALVGPNESGKSSIIKALTYLNNDTKIPDTESTRGSETKDTEIIAGFFLDGEDIREARLTNPTRLVIKKINTGQLKYELTPSPPLRETANRKRIVAQIYRVTSNKKVIKDLENNHPPLLSQLSQLAADVENGPENLPPKLIQLMERYAALLTEHLSENLPKYVNLLQSKLTELAQEERKLNPNDFAINELKKRIPQFLEFADEHRVLAAEYNLKDVVSNPPIPLTNLATLAKLDLKKLLDAANKGDKAEKNNLLTPANKQLFESFRETWTQSGIHVHFDLEGTNLSIQIVDENEAFSSLGERSDGLRQFVALQTFTTVERANKPILLIDEAELHLHYDGQADLVQMLTKQSVAPKVIYSTHSAGCLPEDLGVGVRLLVPNADTRTSKVQNKFWQSKERGFSPLLFGMGATTLAFFPIRYALVTEGPTEMLLLPTILRQATTREYLGFQVVPGLSETSLATLPAMETSGTRVAYFVDADDGGDKLRRALVKLGVEESRILRINRPSGTSYTTEDFIDTQYFTKAVNKILDEFYPEVSKIKQCDVSSPGRIKNLDAYCAAHGIKPLAKTEIAYQLLEFVAHDPSVSIIDSKFKLELKSIYEKIVEELDIKF